jgi:hypothetical protein
MPLLLSEDLAVQEAALPLFERFCNPPTADCGRPRSMPSSKRCQLYCAGSFLQPATQGNSCGTRAW